MQRVEARSHTLYTQFTQFRKTSEEKRSAQTKQLFICASFYRIVEKRKKYENYILMIKTPRLILFINKCVLFFCAFLFFFFSGVVCLFACWMGKNEFIKRKWANNEWKKRGLGGGGSGSITNAGWKMVIRWKINNNWTQQTRPKTYNGHLENSRKIFFSQLKKGRKRFLLLLLLLLKIKAFWLEPTEFVFSLSLTRWNNDKF